MTTAYCKYGFESSYGSGTTSTWYSVYVSNIDISMAKTYVDYNTDSAYSDQVPHKLLTSQSITGTMTFVYDWSSLSRFLYAIAWNTYALNYINFTHISDSTNYSMVLEVSDYTSTNNYTVTYSGVVITDVKILYRINDYIQVEVSFTASNYTIEEDPTKPPATVNYPMSFIDTRIYLAYTDSTASYDLNLSAISVTISRKINTDTSIIGSSSKLKFYDNGYITITGEFTFSEEEYNIYKEIKEKSLIELRVGTSTSSRYISFRPIYIMNEGRTISSGGKVEKSFSFTGGNRSRYRI